MIETIVPAPSWWTAISPGPDGVHPATWTEANQRAYEFAFAELDDVQRDWVVNPVRAVVAPRGTAMRGFPVHGSEGGHYIVFQQCIYNVVSVGRPASFPPRAVALYYDGRAQTTTRRLCAVPISDTLPLWDIMLAQKLLLEHDEPTFLALANVATSSNQWFHRP